MNRKSPGTQKTRARLLAFTQRRSLTLPTLISLILTMDEKSMWKGLLGYFQNGIDTPSASAFIQQRKKLLRFISGGLSLLENI